MASSTPDMSDGLESRPSQGSAAEYVSIAETSISPSVCTGASIRSGCDAGGEVTPDFHSVGSRISRVVSDDEPELPPLPMSPSSSPHDNDSGYNKSSVNRGSPSIDEKAIDTPSQAPDQTSEKPRSTEGQQIESAPARSLGNGSCSPKTETASKASATSILNEHQDMREDGTRYISGVKLFLVTTALCLSIFLMALDNAIIGVAIPKITDEFHSLGDVGWYGSAYLLTISALQLLFGRLYTLYSIKWVYFSAIALFELGSLLCGVANSSVTLIVGRAVAGVGSAGVFSGAVIILAHSVPIARRPLFTGILGSMYGVAVVAGPLLGGILTDKITWRWCFYINLPFGAVTIAAIAVWFHDPDRNPEDDAARPRGGWRARLTRFDPVGTALFVPAIVCLLLALQWGGTQYPWRDARIVALLVLFGVLAAAWAAAQWRQGDLATIAPRLLRQRTMRAASFFAFCIGAAFLSSVYFIPLWFQAVKGVSAVESGVMNLGMLLALVLSSVCAGAIVTVWGHYTPFFWLSTVVMSVGFGLLSTWVPDSGPGMWIGYQVVAGAGVGLGMQQSLIAVQTVLPMDDVPMGTSIIMLLQSLGGAIFVSIAENIFTNKLVGRLADLFPGLDPTSIFNAGATNIAGSVPPEVLPEVIRAYSDALTQTFLMSAGLAAASVFGSIAIEWRSVKRVESSVGVA